MSSGPSHFVVMATGQIEGAKFEIEGRPLTPASPRRLSLSTPQRSLYCVLLGPGTADEQGGDAAEMYGTFLSGYLSKNMALSHTAGHRETDGHRISETASMQT